MISTRSRASALVVRRRLGNLPNDVKAVADPAESGVLTGERRLIGDAHEELRAAAVRIARDVSRPRPCPRVNGSLLCLGLEHAEPARAVLRALGGILRERIASLDDAVLHHPMEGRVPT